DSAVLGRQAHEQRLEARGVQAPPRRPQVVAHRSLPATRCPLVRHISVEFQNKGLDLTNLHVHSVLWLTASNISVTIPHIAFVFQRSEMGAETGTNQSVERAAAVLTTFLDGHTMRVSDVASRTGL